MSRFDFVQYDAKAKDDQTSVKLQCDHLEKLINERVESPRAKALALIKLEECYMWVGKAIRDDQIERSKQPKESEIPF